MSLTWRKLCHIRGSEAQGSLTCLCPHHQRTITQAFLGSLQFLAIPLSALGLWLPVSEARLCLPQHRALLVFILQTRKVKHREVKAHSMGEW